MIPLPTSWFPKALSGESPLGETGAVLVGEGVGALVAEGEEVTVSLGCMAGTATATEVTATALEAAKMPSAVGIEN